MSQPAWALLGYLKYVGVEAKMEVLEAIVDNHPGDVIDDRGPKGGAVVTPLVLAVQEGWVHVVKFLLDHGAEITQIDPGKNPAPHLAVIRGDRELISLFIERLGGMERTIDFTGMEGKTLLHTAAGLGDLLTAEVLIGVGSNVDARATGHGGYSRTPLHYAAEAGHVSICDLLIHSGACVDALDNNTNSVIHVALREPHLEVIESLIAAGANLNIGSRKDRPLPVAIRLGRKAAAELLRANGAEE